MENDFGQIINYISEGGIGEGFFVTYVHVYVCVCVCVYNVSFISRRVFLK